MTRTFRFSGASIEHARLLRFFKSLFGILFVASQICLPTPTTTVIGQVAVDSDQVIARIVSEGGFFSRHELASGSGFVLNARLIADTGWFGTSISNSATSPARLTRNSDIISAIQGILNDQVGDSIKSLTFSADLEGKHALLERKGFREYEVVLNRDNADGDLSERLQEFVSILFFVSNTSVNEEVYRSVKDGKTELSAAVEKLLKNDFRSLQSLDEFGWTFWVPWRISQGLPVVLDKGWLLDSDDAKSFEGWITSDDGVKRGVYWRGVVSGWLSKR